jgi:hypothetical protein
MFRLEGRKMIFQDGYNWSNNARSLILKEKISNKIQDKLIGDFFIFFFYLFGVEFGIIPSSKVNECLKEWISLSGG